MTRKSKNSKTRMYDATVAGRKVRVSVPEDPSAEDVLTDAIRDNFSPEAVAVLANAAMRQFNRSIKHRSVGGEVKWFADLLTKMVGGHHECYRLCTEAGF